jgi:guanylate kinase
MRRELSERSDRLRGRGREGEEAVATRLAAARDEIDCCVDYDYVLVLMNRQFSRTLAALDSILTFERHEDNGP